MFYANNFESRLVATTATTTKRFFLFIVGCMALLAVPSFGQNIHQLYYDNSDWTDANLTELGSGVAANTMTAFYTTPNDQLHVYYSASSNNHIHQLYLETKPVFLWVDQDLTDYTNGEISYTYSGMSGFSIGNAQYVYFCGADELMHEYSYGNNGNSNWVDTPLPGDGANQACGQVDGASTGEWVLAFAGSSNNERFVYYAVPGVDSKGDGVTEIEQLYFNGSVWSNKNVTQTIKGTQAESYLAISGFAIGNDPYLFFTGTDQHLHEYSNVNGWTDSKLNNNTVYGVPAAYVIPGTTQMEVDYFAFSNRDLHQLTYAKGKWTNIDLSSIANSSLYSTIVGFGTTPNDQLHVYAVGSNNDVDQLYFNGSTWSYQTLPSVPNRESGPLAGFAIGNLQYVYYLD